ncbi:MAG: phage portal protein [Pseudoxanthomonas spadix]|nr:MAG: phage portal protein [Pseudoxanthomonas spadix]
MFQAPNLGPNSSQLYGKPTVLARARHLARNDPWAVSALNKAVSNAIATGIQAKAVWGSDKHKAAVERLWKSWVKQSDADCVLNWYAQQALAYRSWKEAGEVFIRLRYRRPEDGLTVPLQVQLIESEQCPAHYYATAQNGNTIRAGIEFDRIGRRVAYWMYREHPGDKNPGVANMDLLVRVPAEQIRHLYRPTRPGELRGMPASASVIVRMFNLDRLDDAVLERQAIANLFTAFYTQKTVVESDDPNREPAEGVVADMESGVDENGEAMAGLEPGTAQELPPGYDVKFSAPPGAGDDYAEFLRGHLMAIAAANDVPYEVLTGDLRNVSDRALKLILNEFRRVIEADQWLYLIPQMCQFVREAWFDQAVLVGALNVPAYAEQRDLVTETLWVPQGWAWSHPVQDVDAETKAVRAGFKSRHSVVLASGEDPDQVNTQIEQDNRTADSMGFVFDSDPRRSSRSGDYQRTENDGQ